MNMNRRSLMAKKSNGGNFGLTVGYPGWDTIEGTLISHSAEGVFFTSKKSGSSTKLNQFYPAAQVMSCYGKVGGDATLICKSDRVPVFRSGKRGKEKPLSVTGLEHQGPFVVTGSDDFPVVIVRSDFATFSGEEKDENAPKRGRKAASDKKPAKADKKEKKSKGKEVKSGDWD